MTPMPDRAWGPAGYGMILINMDTKESWSINDYSTPTSFFLPNDVMVDAGGHTVISSGLRELLATPSVWSDVILELIPERSIIGKIQDVLTWNVPGSQNFMVKKSLDEILTVEQSPEERLSSLTQSRGFIQIRGDDFRFCSGSFNPKGWKNHDDLGEYSPDVWENLLNQALACKMPPPDRAALEEWIETWSEDHYPQDEWEELSQEDREMYADKGEVLSAEDFKKKFHDILDQWAPSSQVKNKFKP
jgi:hypothetical protein